MVCLLDTWKDICSPVLKWAEILCSNVANPNESKDTQFTYTPVNFMGLWIGKRRTKKECWTQSHLAFKLCWFEIEIFPISPFSTYII